MQNVDEASRLEQIETLKARELTDGPLENRSFDCALAGLFSLCFPFVPWPDRWPCRNKSYASDVQLQANGPQWISVPDGDRSSLHEHAKSWTLTMTLRAVPLTHSFRLASHPFGPKQHI